MGEPSSNDFEPEYVWPRKIGDDSAIAALAKRFPTLRGLDLGFGNFGQAGVGLEDLTKLCIGCANMMHLDLSQVFMMIDFGPALRMFALRAPHLRSLAIYGLELPTDDLLLFGAQCNMLRTIHFNGCKYSDEALLEFLRVAKQLMHLDLSLGNVPQREVLKWLEERQSSALHGEGTPVGSLTVVRSVVILPADHQAHTQAMEAVGAAPPGGEPIPLPTARVANPSWHPKAEARLHAFHALARNASPALTIRMSNEYGNTASSAAAPAADLSEDVEACHPIPNVSMEDRTRVLERAWG